VTKTPRNEAETEAERAVYADKAAEADRSTDPLLRMFARVVPTRRAPPKDPEKT